jgi:hypothetical protein
MYSLAANLSKEPINSTLPSGSTKKAIDGLANVLGGHMKANQIAKQYEINNPTVTDNLVNDDDGSRPV